MNCRFPHGVVGIRRGLVVTMPGSQACVRRFESPLDPQGGWPGIYKCAALWGTVYGPSATERPLGTIREE